MKALLIKLKERAAGEILYLGGEKAVHFLPDEDLLPAETPFPCVGLKDGDVTTLCRIGAEDRYLSVDIIGYVLVNTPDGVIMGTANEPGILDLIEDLKTAFKEYEPDGYRWLLQDSRIKETPSITVPVAGEDRLIQKKKFSMQWYRQVVSAG